jgi:hypothetical protein
MPEQSGRLSPLTQIQVHPAWSSPTKAADTATISKTVMFTVAGFIGFEAISQGKLSTDWKSGSVRPRFD